jgi:hypothetical protein
MSLYARPLVQLLESQVSSAGFPSLRSDRESIHEYQNPLPCSPCAINGDAGLWSFGITHAYYHSGSPLAHPHYHSCSSLAHAYTTAFA